MTSTTNSLTVIDLHAWRSLYSLSSPCPSQVKFRRWKTQSQYLSKRFLGPSFSWIFEKKWVKFKSRKRKQNVDELKSHEDNTYKSYWHNNQMMHPSMALSATWFWTPSTCVGLCVLEENTWHRGRNDLAYTTNIQATYTFCPYTYIWVDLQLKGSAPFLSWI